MKLDSVLKIIYVILAICALFVAQDFLQTFKNKNRYRSAGQDQVIDTYTGVMYMWEQNAGWSVLDNEGNIKSIKKLPQ